MADTTYKVIIDMESRGSLESKLPTQGKLDMLDKKTSSIGIGLGAIGGRMSDLFTGAVEKVGAVAETVAKIGAGAGLAAVAYGVGHLNNELEKTQISLAAVFAANGVSSNMGQGMTLAADMMTRMRKDAAALPGETEDLVGIFRSITIPGLRAGANVDQLEKLSADIMAAGASAGLQMDMVAREAGQLVAGRAGAHNILGSTLFGLTGDEAEKFNKSSGAERLSFLTKEMGKYSQSIDVFGHSFEGLSSSFKDQAKNYLRLATEPLFGSIKGLLERGNSWLGQNNGKLEAMAHDYGVKLAGAFDKGVSMLETGFPKIIAWADKLEERVVGMWEKASPLVERVEGLVAKAFDDPQGSIDKMGGVLKMYAAMKAGSALAPALGGLASAGGNLGSMLGAGGGVLELGALGPAAVVAAGALIAAAGAVDILTDTTSQYHDAAMALVDGMGKDASAMSVEFDHLKSSLTPIVDFMGLELLGSLRLLSSAARNVVEAWTGLIGEVNYLTGGIFNQMRKDEPVKIDRDDVSYLRGTGAGMGTLTGHAETNDPAKNKHINGGGGTNIQKVEIVVHQNSDPSRVARAVVDKLADMQRYRTASRDVPNYSR